MFSQFHRYMTSIVTLKAPTNRMFKDNAVIQCMLYKRIIDVFLLLTFYNGKSGVSQPTTHFVLIISKWKRRWCSVSISADPSVALTISLMEQIGKWARIFRWFVVSLQPADNCKLSLFMNRRPVVNIYILYTPPEITFNKMSKIITITQNNSHPSNPGSYVQVHWFTMLKIGHNILVSLVCLQ